MGLNIGLYSVRGCCRYSHEGRSTVPESAVVQYMRNTKLHFSEIHSTKWWSTSSGLELETEIVRAP